MWARRKQGVWPLVSRCTLITVVVVVMMTALPSRMVKCGSNGRGLRLYLNQIAVEMSKFTVRDRLRLDCQLGKAAMPLHTCMCLFHDSTVLNNPS